MQKVRFLYIIVLLLIAGFWVTLPSGCANIIPPAGGPRDTLPPRLLLALPKDSTVNFSSNRIVLTFDEYIDDLQEPATNLLFTPTFEKGQAIDVRGREITIRFKDSLQHNTTYILNFGNAIRDINENNVLKNFIYTFSTGPVLDSLTVSGKVILAETGKTDSTLIVILHRNLTDSAVLKERPVYVARVNADGSFQFNNLPKGRFAIYALGEAGSFRRYQTKTQLFAFANDTVTTGKSKDITLFAYREQEANPPSGSTSTQQTRTNTAADRRLRFTTPSGTLDLQSDYVLNFPVPLRRFDTSAVSLTTDSSFSATPYTLALDSSKKTLHLRSNWKEGTTYNFILNKEFAEDTSGRKLLKTDTLHFTTKKKSDYGQLRLSLRNVDLTKNPVLLFVQGDKVVYAAPVKSGRFTAALFEPGEYDLRILYDDNNNGKWDPGQFFKSKRQPELVRPVDQKITVKAAWENEFERSVQ